MSYKPQVLKPSTEQDFETLCAHIYGEVFNCKTPTIYGRRGQKQYGLDILVYKDNLNKSSNLIGVQCKHVTKLPFDGPDSVTIVKEIAKADSGQQQISQLLIATSLPSDRKLTDAVNALSEKRVSEGKFPVEVQFWNDIENHIFNSSNLSERYHSNSDYSEKIKQAKERFNKERYSEVIDSLTVDNIKLMNHVEKYEVYYLLANCYHLIEQNDKFTHYASKIKDFGWCDERHNVLIIIDNIINDDTDNALKIIGTCIIKEPDNTQYEILKYLVEMNQGSITDFEDLPEAPRNAYSIKLNYMRYYSNYNQFDKYDEIDKLISKDERSKPSFIILSLESSLLRYEAIKSQHHYIEAELNSLESNLNINQIDVPSLKKYVINSIITANCVINNEESVKHYYRLTKTTQCGILPETIINLVSFTKRNSDKAFFLKVYKDHSNSEIIKYLIDGLYHFGEMNKLNYLIDSNSDIGEPLTNEIRSFVAVNQLDNTVFLTFLDEVDLFSTNTLRGLALLGLRLYRTNNEKFDKLNRTISSINTSDSDLKTLLADYYFKTKQYRACSDTLDTLINQSNEEYLLIIQIHSLIESFQYQKAKNFVDQNSHNFDKYLSDFASLVSKLGNKTQDFSAAEMLLPRLDKYSNSSWYWRLKLFLSIHNDNIGQLKKDTRLIPLDLDNNPADICWLASYELRYSKQEKAIERVINLWRSNPTDLEVLSAIQDLLLDTMLSRKLPNNSNPLFDLNFIEVVDGCFVSYFEEDKLKGKYIDSKSSGKNLDIIISPNDELGQQFLGKAVGEEFEIIGKFGVRRNIKIEEILSIPLAIYRKNIEMTSDINNPFNMVSFTADFNTEEGIAKFIKDINQTSRSNEQLERQLKAYQESPMTITCLADYIGKDISEITYSWLNDSRFTLRTIDDHYTVDISIDDLETLLEKQSTVVIDLFTLLELQRLETLDLITSNLSIYIPKILLTNLKALSDRHIYEYKGGDKPLSIHSNDNNFTVNEMDIQLLEKRSNDLKFLVEYVESNMQVTPAYGNNSNSKIIEALNSFLPEADKSIIRLCQEKSIPLLSLDARLRALAHQAGVDTINFHDYLLLSTSTNKSRYINFQTNQFIDNRNAADFKIHDLLDFALKGNNSLNIVVNKFINHISLHYDFDLILKQLGILINIIISKKIMPTNGFIERVCEILFCNLANYNKLDFDNHKMSLNSHFETYFHRRPIRVNSFENMKTVKDNTLYIIYGTSRPLLCARNID
ncbi:PIN domain-containing protein [Psychrobacter sp. GW64-MNA-CIBAN-0177]|uniref:PIN domain-containing protein n=1 Tax=Psychrobacter sp. GW64-MNA-CIBAN-0177 TaxID=3140449 RepID=UPI003316FA0E